MLPGLDGFEICRILRQEMSLPILMLTAAAELPRLDDAPEVLRELDAMAHAFENPNGRQELLRLQYRSPAAAV